MTSTRNYLGSYRLIKLIRGGQTCNVWEAIKDGMRDRVALKVLLGEHLKKKHEVDALRHEARVGNMMDHENVIKVFEFIERYEFPFLVMQLFNARNLKQEIRENKQVVATNVPQIVKQCAKGLGHLHDKGWVHCDVKPDNFLVNEQGTVKLIDFSIAQSIKKKAGLGGLFGKKKVRGTRSYMAPEQIRGKTLGPPCDVYGLGCVLHELLSGKPPFSGSNPDELLQKHLRSAPPGLLVYNRAVSDRFSDLVLRMLAKSPDKRPQSMNDVLSELESMQIYRAGNRPTLLD